MLLSLIVILLCNLKHYFMTIDNYLGKEKSQVKQRGGKTMVLGDWSKTSHQNREGLNFLGRYRPHVQTTLSIPVFN